jgi:hypothetical protein
MDIDQIVVSGKNDMRNPGFGLLEGGKKWRVSESNFKREIIMAGMGWGHWPEHNIKRELKEKTLVALDLPNIHTRVLVINLIRLKKNHFGVVARSLWSQLASLHGK